MSTAPNGRQAKPAPTEATQTPDAGLLDRVVEATHAARYSIEEVRYMAKAAGTSAMFGMNESQAFVLMMIAESRGLHPIEAVQRYHVIHGRPAMKAEAMLAELMARGWEVEWLTEEDDPNEQAAMFRHPRKHPKGQRIGFTAERAKVAELKSDIWKKYPANMLRARAISNACRMLDPGIVIGLYTPEEISDMDDSPRPASVERPAPAPRTEPRVITAPSREYSEPVLPVSDFRRWLDDECTARNDVWKNTCLIDQIEFKPIANPNQVGNHLISAWIAEGALDEAKVLNEKGTRDRHKVAAEIKAAWALDADDVKEEVQAYLKAKLLERAKEAGVELVDEGETVAVVASPAPAEAPADDGWQEGRE